MHFLHLIAPVQPRRNAKSAAVASLAAVDLGLISADPKYVYLAVMQRQNVEVSTMSTAYTNIKDLRSLECFMLPLFSIILPAFHLEHRQLVVFIYTLFSTQANGLLEYAPKGQEKCPLNVCCSKWGCDFIPVTHPLTVQLSYKTNMYRYRFCGTSEEFCGKGCANGCDKVKTP